jgi:excisionase family DNA binding protein
VAFTTGQVARYCFVTADTILNWIRAGTLRAQRTPGGQYRILYGDLIAFMDEHRMSTDLVNAELRVRPYCWEYFCQGAPSEACQTCIVYRSCTLDCATLGEHVDRSCSQNESCDHCEYHGRYISADPDPDQSE